MGFTNLNFSLWFFILLSVKLKPNSFHTRDYKPRKLYSMYSVLAVYGARLSSYVNCTALLSFDLQRNLNAVMQLFHLVSLENLAETLQILNCDSTVDGKADL